MLPLVSVQTLLGRPIGKTVEFELHSSLSPGQSATWAMPITHSRVAVAVQYCMIVLFSPDFSFTLEKILVDRDYVLDSRCLRYAL
ncbi:60S ribosomal protein L8 [Fusarium oxysporum f. sp. albedinis]|nr:60S ribosomal protein L8 [Fusarium oxysporum f. sp. albedinis]